MRLFAALGPGNIVAAQRAELKGDWKIVPETSITFSGQLYGYCRIRGIQALFTSHNAAADSLVAGEVELRNVPRFWEAKKGWRFHVSVTLYAFKLAYLARQFRADLALIDSGTAHYFALSAFKLLGIPIAINFNNVRWPQGFEPRGHVARAIRLLDSWFFRRIAIGTIGCSPECGIQARADGADRLPYFMWCGQFRAVGFVPNDLDAVQEPFRLLFAGRVERNKGVFDLISIAGILRKVCRVEVIIEICGSGGALQELRAAVADSGNTDRIIVRGRLERPELLLAYRRANAVIVPTRGDFCEGMPLVCAEAVLSGRPVVTSRLSNALPIMGHAIAEAVPEDVESYANVVCRLASDAAYYAQLRAACISVSHQFLDRNRSYPAAVDQLLATVCPGWQPLNCFNAIFSEIC